MLHALALPLAIAIADTVPGIRLPDMPRQGLRDR